MMSLVGRRADEVYAPRLRMAAVEVALPTGPGLDQAIELAEELVAAGLGGPATIDVAALRRGTVRSDAEPRVRLMLDEFGVEVPPAGDEMRRYRLLLWLFGYADLPFERFEGPFYVRLTGWDEQDELDRALVRLLHARELVSRTTERRKLEDQMRAIVRSLFSRIA